MWGSVVPSRRADTMAQRMIVVDGIPGTFLHKPAELEALGTIELDALGATVTADTYEMGDVYVFCAQEPIGPAGAMAWHLSLSPRQTLNFEEVDTHRLITWDEIKFARYRLIPHDVMMAVALPPAGEYLDMNPHVWHVHEVRTLGTRLI